MLGPALCCVRWSKQGVSCDEVFVCGGHFEMPKSEFLGSRDVATGHGSRVGLAPSSTQEMLALGLPAACR